MEKRDQKSVSFHFTAVSSNKKTGPIPTVMSSANQCPKSCPFVNNGCYAELGPIAIWWNRTKLSTKGIVEKIKSIPQGRIWRMNTAGELPNNDEKLNKNFLRSLVSVNRGKKGFTYTHLPVENHKHAGHNKSGIEEANKKGFAVNLSANNPEQALRYKELGIAPVVTVVNSNQKDDFKIGNTKFMICPAVKTGVSCAECGLCARSKRRSVICFPAHGSGKRKAEKAAEV